MPLANLYLAKFEQEQRIRDAENRIAEQDPTMTSEERDELLGQIDSAKEQLVPIDQAIADRMAEIDAQPRGDGGPITYAQLEADRDALRAREPDLQQSLEAAQMARDNLILQLSSARTGQFVAVGQVDLHSERLETFEDDLRALRQQLVALGVLGDLGVVRGHAAGRLVFEGFLDENAFKQLLAIRDRLADLRKTRAEVDELRGDFRERFVGLTNEVIVMEQELIDEIWGSFLKQSATEIFESGVSLAVSGLTGGAGGILVDAVTQIGINVLFLNEDGVIYENYDETAMREAYHQARRELEGEGVQNDCSLTHLREFLETGPDTLPKVGWSDGVAETVALMDQFGIYAGEKVYANFAQSVFWNPTRPSSPMMMDGQTSVPQ